jgi:hypothetical protein
MYSCTASARYCRLAFRGKNPKILADLCISRYLRWNDVLCLMTGLTWPRCIRTSLHVMKEISLLVTVTLRKLNGYFCLPKYRSYFCFRIGLLGCNLFESLHHWIPRTHTDKIRHSSWIRRSKGIFKCLPTGDRGANLNARCRTAGQWINLAVMTCKVANVVTKWRQLIIWELLAFLSLLLTLDLTLHYFNS